MPLKIIFAIFNLIVTKNLQICYNNNMENANYAKKIENLLQLPQSLCRQCGQCCTVAIYKYGLAYDEIIELINNPLTDEKQVKGAKDFLSIFEPISYEKAIEFNEKAVHSLLKKLDKPKEKVTFFHCKYLTDDGKCSIHENRPDLCKKYPVCYRDMFYFDGCGYAEQARKNWAEVEKILSELGLEL